VLISDSQTGRQQGELTGLNVGELAVSSRSDRVAMIVGGKQIKLLDWSDPSAVGSREMSIGEADDDAVLLDLALNPFGTILAVSDSQRQVHLWNIETGQVIEPRLQLLNSASALCFSRDGELLAVATHDKTLQIWKGSQF
jgi:WD40 repeat protein